VKTKVHWIIDGIADIEAESLEDAEKIVNEELTKIINQNENIKVGLGATSIQGKAYLPGSKESKLD
jgi:hypothetical protein